MAINKTDVELKQLRAVRDPLANELREVTRDLDMKTEQLLMITRERDKKARNLNTVTNELALVNHQRASLSGVLEQLWDYTFILRVENFNNPKFTTFQRRSKTLLKISEQKVRYSWSTLCVQIRVLMGSWNSEKIEDHQKIEATRFVAPTVRLFKDHPSKKCLG
jgi:signal recognition particle subunit SEC65